MSFRRVCLFLVFEVIVTIPTAIMIYWLLSLHTDNFTGDNMMVYLHGIVMMFAFTYLMAQGIALVRVCPSSRHCAKLTHSVFNTLSLLFGIAGLILMISYKSRNNKSHLYSLHSWCGLLLLFMLLVQFMGGCIVLQSCCKGASLKSRMNYVPNHVAMGTAVLLLAAVCVISGVVNLKAYIGVARAPDKGLDFENSLLNLMAGSAVLVFVVILCVAVSRRSRKSGRSSADSLEAGKLHFRNGSSASPHDRSDRYREESKSSVKSKNISEDTAYSSGTGSAHRQSGRSLSRPRDLGDPAPAAQRREVEPQHSRRGSAHPPHRDSGHRDGVPHSPQRPQSPRVPETEGGPTSPGRTSVRSQRAQRDNPANRSQDPVRSPDNRETFRQGSFSPPSSAHHPGPHHSGPHHPGPHHPGPHRLPSSSQQPRSPDSQGYHRSSSVPQPAPSIRSDHSYQIPYHEPPPDLPRDMTSRSDNAHHVTSPGHHGNALLCEDSSPDIPPLFENNANVSHLRASRRGVPPPINMQPLSPPVQFAPVNVVSPFPSRYGGQVLENGETKQATTYNPDQQSSERHAPTHPDPVPPHSSYPPQIHNPHSQLSNPHSQLHNPQIQDNPHSPGYSPQQQTTTFNARPPSRHQVARLHRYEARRAKVEQANLELQRPVTPPASSYTESLAPARICTSPLRVSSPESFPDVDSSVLSDDVDGAAPRRGRTSYRNAVRDDDPPPPVPPPPQKFEMLRGGSKDDEQGICWL